MNFIDIYWNYFKYLPLADKYFEADKNAEHFYILEELIVNNIQTYKM